MAFGLGALVFIIATLALVGRTRGRIEFGVLGLVEEGRIETPRLDLEVIDPGFRTLSAPDSVGSLSHVKNLAIEGVDLENAGLRNRPQRQPLVVVTFCHDHPPRTVNLSATFQVRCTQLRDGNPHFSARLDELLQSDRRAILGLSTTADPDGDVYVAVPLFPLDSLTQKDLSVYLPLDATRA